MSSHKRYRASALRWYDYADHFWVKCPECDQAASIELPFAFNTQKAIVKCRSCFWHTDYETRLRYEPAAGGRCTVCCAKLAKPSISLPKPNKSTFLLCKSCKAANHVFRWEKTFKKYGNKGARDPIFGLLLYFIAEISNQTFWIINLKHLETLLAYLEANLRQKPLVSYNMTLVEKLPKFIIEARNRDKIISILRNWKEVMIENNMQ